MDAYHTDQPNPTRGAHNPPMPGRGRLPSLTRSTFRCALAAHTLTSACTLVAAGSHSQPGDGAPTLLYELLPRAANNYHTGPPAVPTKPYQQTVLTYHISLDTSTKTW
jgi:hypothetical protein